jgi:hypothetical protein
LDEHQENSIYMLIFGVLLSLLIFVFSYQQPIYNAELITSSFELVTLNGDKLGPTSSTINMKHELESSIGNFLVVIKTYISKPQLNKSIYARDVKYRVIFRVDNSLVEQLEGNYFGALNTVESYISYTSFSLPSLEYPMNTIRYTYGNIKLKIDGIFYNTTSNEVLAKNTEEINIFVIHPQAKIVISTLMIILFSIVFIRRRKLYKEFPNVWENQNNT